MSTVAVCCDDLGLMSDARRLCAVAGLDAEVTGTHDVRRWWAGASVVLLDAAAARQILADGRVPRRARVAVLARLADVADWQVAVALGAEQVAVLPADERPLLAGVLSVRELSGGAVVVACVPATGGAGASTAAAGLALIAARRGVDTVLVDGDETGGGLDLVFGLEHAAGVRWPDLLGPTRALPSESLPDGLLRPASGLALVSWDRRGAARPDAVSAWSALVPAARSRAELVVVDLPRSTSLDHTAPVDVVLLVVRAGVRPTVAAVQAADRLRGRCDDVRVVVRSAGRGGLGAAEVAAAVRLPLAAQFEEDRRLAAAADDGQLPRLIGRLGFDRLVDDLCSLRRMTA